MKPEAARLSAIAGFFILLIVLFPTLAAASPRPESAPGGESDVLSENEYWNLIDTSRQAIIHLKGQPAGEIKSQLNNLAAQWSAVREVKLADGTMISLDNGYLLAALQASPPDLNQIENIFESLQSAHRTYPSKFFSAADLQSLKQILARPEFNGLNQSSSESNDWIQNLWDRFSRWLESLLSKISGGPTIYTDLSSPLAILAALLLVGILVYVLRSLLVDFAAEAQWNGSGNDADERLSAESAFEKAHRLSRGGDYRAAVRYLYLSSLLLLDERGLLRYDRSKTNREYLQSVSDSPELAGSLRDVIDVFDEVWYGYHPMDQDSFQQYSERVDDLKEKEK